MIVTGNPEWAGRMRAFRNHGIARGFRERMERGEFRYDMSGPGLNYRLSDLHAALGWSQLGKQEGWLSRRSELASRYSRMLAGLKWIELPFVESGNSPAWHLYAVRLRNLPSGLDRDAVFAGLRRRGIGVNVHYPPVHCHSWYRRRYATGPGMCPRAETAWEELLSLPLYSTMPENHVDRVVESLCELAEAGDRTRPVPPDRPAGLRADRETPAERVRR